MAEDKKPDVQEDWDNLPLDPDAADDWDDIPPPAAEKAPVAATSTALEKVSPAEDYYEAQSGRHKNDEGSADDQPYAPPPDGNAAGPEPEDDFDAPDEAPPESADFDTPGEAPEEAPDDADAPEPPDEDDFDAPDFAAPPAPAEGDAPEAAEDETIPMPNISEPKPPTKKVELDIEGMQFKEDEPPSEAPATPAATAAPEEKAPPKAAAPPPKEEAAAPEAGPKIRRKIPRLKLLLIVVPALLIVGGLIFGLLALFSEPDTSELPPPPPVFSPDLPPREAVLGEMRLESFYISFPGRSNDTIIELSLVLHYNDSPDALLIRGKMTDLRDIIYRVTQGRGSLIITDSELQRGLREELRERANALLGGDYISYVQIDQIRILQ